MGFVPQILDRERGLLAELSGDEGVSWQLASVLRDLQEDTIGSVDPLRYWRERAETEHQHEERARDLEYVEEEVEVEEEEKVDTEDEENKEDEDEYVDQDTIVEMAESAAAEARLRLVVAMVVKDEKCDYTQSQE
jgi:hypothetical protein